MLILISSRPLVVATQGVSNNFLARVEGHQIPCPGGRQLVLTGSAEQPQRTSCPFTSAPDWLSAQP